MKNNLFSNLSKYAASNTTSPLENFITEAFAWMLQNDSEALETLINLLKNKLAKNSIQNFDLDHEMKVSTQINFDGVFPDMLIENVGSTNPWHIIFEHKVWSELSENQLQNYRNYADNRGFNYILVLITALPSQHRDNPDVALCWSDIASAFNKMIPSNDPVKSWIRSEFLNLLTENQLGITSPINPLSVQYYQSAKELDKKFRNLCIFERNLSSPIIEQSSFSQSNNVRQISGRIGYEIFTMSQHPHQSQNWFPALFSGFLIDSWDHGIADLMPNNAPIVCIILSVDQIIHQLIKNSVNFNNFAQELSKSLEGHAFWKVSKRKEGINDWHPLIVHSDLISFFKNCKDPDNQHVFYNVEIKFIKDLILQMDSFNQLVDEIKNNLEA